MVISGTQLNSLIRNGKTLLKNPKIARAYLSYWGSKLTNSGRAIRTFPDGIMVTELSGFSEFHSCAEFVSPREREFIYKYPMGEGAVIDVGANLGIVSCMLAERFPERVIHSFEPAPSTFRALKANIELNSCANIRALPYAVAERDGEVPFSADPIGRATNSISAQGGNSVINVPCLTLDSYVEDNSIQNIAFLKVDVEGYETLVFRGAERVLARRLAAIIYYEVCPEITVRAGYDPALPTRMLVENGYRIYRLSEQASLEPISVSVIEQTVLENWVALRS